MPIRPAEPTPRKPRKTRECIRAWIGSCSGKVTFGPDPFAYEVYDDDTRVWECEYHREQAALDV